MISHWWRGMIRHILVKKGELSCILEKGELGYLRGYLTIFQASKATSRELGCRFLILITASWPILVIGACCLFIRVLFFNTLTLNARPREHRVSQFENNYRIAKDDEACRKPHRSIYTKRGFPSFQCRMKKVGGITAFVMWLFDHKMCRNTIERPP
jgi:hypothetical protein